MPHRLPQIAARGAREQVVMIAHEAAGVDFERESLAALSEPFEEGPTVPSVAKIGRPAAPQFMT